MRLLRVLGATALAVGILAVGASGATGLVRQGAATCTAFAPLWAGASELDGSPDFDPGGYTELGKEFRKAAKATPKELKPALKKIGKFYVQVGKSDRAADAGTAYTRGLEKYANALTQFSRYYADNCGGASGGGSTSSGSGGGSLTFGSETIALASSRCFLQEQTAAGQKILFTGQATGTNAAGDEVLLDVSRYDASSQFAGDDFSIDVGDPRSPDAVSWSGRADTGAIERSGSTLRATDVEVRNDDRTETIRASFVINC